MHPNYKQNEKAIKNIIHQHILLSDTNKQLKFIIYYKKFKTSKLSPTTPGLINPLYVKIMSVNSHAP